MCGIALLYNKKIVSEEHQVKMRNALSALLGKLITAVKRRMVADFSELALVVLH